MGLYPIIYRCILGLLLLSAIAAFVWALRGSRKHLRKKHSKEKGNLDRDMLNFLQALYAEGQIDKEEYEARKRDLAA